MGFYTAQLTDDGTATVTFLLADGVTLRTVTSEGSPDGYPRVVAALAAGEDLTAEDVALLTRPAEYRITRLDDRVSFDTETGVLTFDGVEIHSTLASTIVRYFREGRSTTGIVRFLENLAANPSRRSREQLFDWTERQSLTITDDGHFIAYKGVRHDGTSVHSGPANIDGVDFNGHVPNKVGSVISVPREYVQDDPNVGCSHGLHVGSYGYGQSFAARLLHVKVNPRDVVSVPSDCAHAKLRCCRYEVIAIHDAPVDNISTTYEPTPGTDFYDVDEEDDFDYDEAFEGALVEQAVQPKFLDRLRAALGRPARKVLVPVKSHPDADFGLWDDDDDDDF